MNFNQVNFNFDSEGDESGYQKWQEELDARKQEFEKRHGLIIGAKVEVTLHGEEKPLVGIITLCDSKEPQNRAQLRLRIASRTITFAEIENIARL